MHSEKKLDELEIIVRVDTTKAIALLEYWEES